MFEKKFQFFLSFVVVFIVLIFASQAGGQFDLMLSPLLVEVDIVPGATKSFKLHLRNEDKLNGVNLIAYTADMRESQIGAYEVLEKGQGEYSCADWLQIPDTSFALGPGDSRDVEVRIRAPRDAFGGRYAAVVFEVVPQEAPGGKEFGAVTLHYKLPAFVEVTIKRFGGVQRKAEITDLKVTVFSSEKLKKDLGEEALGVTASVQNQGNIHLKGKGTLIIKDEQGRTKRRVPLGGGRGAILPGATVDFTSFLMKPPPADYIARAMISFGGLSPVIAEVPFTISRTRGSALGTFKASSYIALNVKPEELDMKIPRRGFRAVSFSLANEEADSVEIKAYLKDLEYDEQGGLLVLDSAESGRSCKEWLTLDPEQLTVPPGKRLSVKLTMQAPPEGSGGYYACVIFDALLKHSKAGVISTPFQIPVLISVPGDLEAKARILDMDVSASLGKPASFGAIFKNTGNVHLKPSGKLSLGALKEIQRTDDIIFTGEPKYEPLAELDLEEVEQYVLPGGIRMMQAVYLGALEAGKYRAEVSIDYGGSEPARFRTEFRIK